MALNFYLNDINDNYKINVQTNATFTSKIGDFDIGTLELEWSKTKNKIAPYTKLFIEDTTQNDVWCFVVLSDNVSIVRKKPTIIYLHELSVIQNTYEWTTQLVRNSVFTQPFANKKAKLKAVGTTNVSITKQSATSSTYEQSYGVFLAYDYNASDYMYSYERITISSREKIKRAYISIKTLTSAFQNVSETVDGFQMSNPRLYKENFLDRISFKINKYASRTATTPVDSMDVFVGSDSIVELDKSFFQVGYWYELRIGVTRPAIVDFDSMQDYYFTYSELSGMSVGESRAIPSIQTILDCALHLDVYYYSMLDVLRILRNEARKLYNGAVSKTDLYSLPTSSDTSGVYQVLSSTPAPDLSFTSTNLWECVAETLKYIDAIPTLDENNYLGFEYLNDYARSSITIEKVDEKSSLTNEYYTNSLVANYQNARQDNAIIYPAKNIFKRVSSKKYGVPTKDDYQLKVDKPIDYIDSVLLLFPYIANQHSYNYHVDFWTNANVYANKHQLQFYGDFVHIPLDITNVVYEENIYSLLPMGLQSDLTPNQLNTLYYAKGSNTIYLGGVQQTATNINYSVYKYAINLSMNEVFGITTRGTNIGTYVDLDSIPEVYDLQYCIKYHGIYDGRVSQESPITKHQGETFVTQEQGGTNLNRMGNNMQGLIARLGNEIEAVTIPVTPYGSRIKKGSLWIDDDGKKYIANLVKTTFSTSSQKVMVEAQFSRNFNLLSQFTRINQERRYYEIDAKLVSKGYENIVEYIYLSLAQVGTQQIVAFSKQMLRGILKNTFIKPENQIKADFATIDSYTYQEDTNPTKANIYAPFHAYGLGNSICFEIGFESANNAEDRLLGSSSLKNEVTLYVDTDGFADKLNVALYSGNFTNQFLYFTENFPDLTNFFSNNSSLFDKLVNINGFYYYKKPNEIFHLNYSIAFLPYEGDDIMLGDVLINNNPIIQESLEPNVEREFYLYAGDELYSIIDNKIDGINNTSYGRVTIAFVENENDDYAHSGSLTFTLASGTIESAKAWCIADNFGNIYIAANQELTNTNSVTIYYLARRDRIS